MKKILPIILIASSIFTTSAQEKANPFHRVWFATAQIGFTQTKTGDAQSTNTTFLPVVGTLLTPSVAVALGAGVVNIKSQNGATKHSNMSLMVLQPLIRKYHNVAGGLNFFVQGAMPIISGKDKVSELQVSQFGLAASSGLSYMVTKSISVEFSYNLINLSQTTLTPKTGPKTTVTDISITHITTAEAAYNGMVGGSKPSLTTPLSFGFKFLF